MDILGGSQTILSPENDSKYMNAYFVLLNINCIEETALLWVKKTKVFNPNSLMCEWFQLFQHFYL